MENYLCHNYPTFNSQNMLSIQLYAEKQQMNLQAEAAKDNIHTANKIALANHKHQLDMQKEERRVELSEIIHRKRQLTTKSIAENSDGFLMMELISPDGRHSFSASICPMRYFRAKYYFSADSVLEENILNIVWQDKKTGIFLSGKKMDAKAMDRAFLAKGVAFRIPRRTKPEIMDQIFAFLINRAEIIEVPRCVGWTKNSDGSWVLETEETHTLEGMYYEK